MITQERNSSISINNHSGKTKSNPCGGVVTRQNPPNGKSPAIKITSPLSFVFVILLLLFLLVNHAMFNTIQLKLIHIIIVSRSFLLNSIMEHITFNQCHFVCINYKFSFYQFNFSARNLKIYLKLTKTLNFSEIFVNYEIF